MFLGMFPYVCIATMPLFCQENWPRKLKQLFVRVPVQEPLPSNVCIYQSKKSDFFQNETCGGKIKLRHKFVVLLLFTYCGLQIFLPYSHFITKVIFEIYYFSYIYTFFFYYYLNEYKLIFTTIFKGYNNWTNGLYGYSWDMMVHSWDTVMVVVKVVDNNTGKEHFVDSSAYTLNDRWNKHADMCVQYAQCLKRNIKSEVSGK